MIQILHECIHTYTHTLNAPGQFDMFLSVPMNSTMYAFIFIKNLGEKRFGIASSKLFTAFR